MATATKAARVKEKNRQLHAVSRLAKVTELKSHPQNPNLGNVDEIAKSLERFGQYRPVVVNVRNGFIVAGHHTWLAARQLGWEEVSIVEIDVDEPTHLAIMVADNRLSDLRQTDESMLDQLLQAIVQINPNDLMGTGFTELDVADLHTRVEEMMSEGVSTVNSLIADQRKAELDLRKSKTFDGSDLGDEPDDEEDFDDDDLEGEGRVGRRQQDDDEDDGDLENEDETMNGGLVQFTPPEDLTFPGSGELEIPKLDTDPAKLMHFDEIPPNLIAWAGSATKHIDDPKQWWLYNWGIDSTSGMQQNRSQVIPAFFCFDEYFDNWWWYPERYAGKLVNSGIKYIVTPDYSMESNQSRAFAIWQLYRNRWMARYFQEIGLKIVPNVSWKDGDELFLKKYVLATLPKELPLIAMQAQTINMEEVDIKQYRRHVQLVLDTLEPKGLLLYTGKQTDAAWEGVQIPCPVFRVESRLTALGEQAKQRKRKTTI